MSHQQGRAGTSRADEGRRDTHQADLRPSRRVMAEKERRRRAGKPGNPAPASYPPGHFMQPVRAWVGPFGPLWQPQCLSLTLPHAGDAMQRMLHREQQAEAGSGWGQGTVLMTGTPSNSRPGFMR